MIQRIKLLMIQSKTSGSSSNRELHTSYPLYCRVHLIVLNGTFLVSFCFFVCFCFYIFIFLLFWNVRPFISNVKVLLVEIFKKYQLPLLKKTFILANRVDPSGKLHSAAAHNGLSCFLLSCLSDAMH